MICKEFAILTGIILTENDENALCVDELTHSLEYTCRKIMPLAQQARLQHAQHIDATQVYDMSLGRLSDFVLGCQEWMFTPDKIRIIRTGKFEVVEHFSMGPGVHFIDNLPSLEYFEMTEREVERHELFTASNEENGYLMRYVLRGWQHMLSLRSGVGSYLSRYSELADQLEHRATSQAGVVVSSTAECEFLILGNQASAPQVWYVMAVKVRNNLLCQQLITF